MLYALVHPVHMQGGTGLWLNFPNRKKCSHERCSVFRHCGQERWSMSSDGDALTATSSAFCLCLHEAHRAALFVVSLKPCSRRFAWSPGGFNSTQPKKRQSKDARLTAPLFVWVLGNFHEAWQRFCYCLCINFHYNSEHIRFLQAFKHDSSFDNKVHVNSYRDLINPSQHTSSYKQMSVPGVDQQIQPIAVTLDGWIIVTNVFSRQVSQSNCDKSCKQ